MPAYFMFIVLGVLPNQAQFKSDKVDILVDVSSSAYTYVVMNHSSDPVVGFEIPEHASYNFTVPKGWQHDASQGLFKCRTQDPSAAIADGQKGEFCMRVSSAGAILGAVSAHVVFRSGDTAVISGVWAPVRQPRSHTVLVTATIVAIVAAHAVIVGVRGRRNRRAQRRAS